MEIYLCNANEHSSIHHPPANEVVYLFNIYLILRVNIIDIIIRFDMYANICIGYFAFRNLKQMKRMHIAHAHTTVHLRIHILRLCEIV